VAKPAPKPAESEATISPSTETEKKAEMGDVTPPAEKDDGN